MDEALTVATEIADALAAAHRHGIVHRDLKPGNVMLTKAGTKLLDFGLAKLKKSGEPAAPFASTQMASLTAEGTIAGTLQYMAPEQLEGKEADPRSDIFAFGAVLYEMLTGRRAFQGDNQASIISAIMSSHPPAVSSLQPLTPPALDRLAGKCLAKDPEARWQNAADLADALRWNAEAADRSASGIGLLTTAGVRPRRRVLALAAAVLVLAAVVPSAVVWRLRPAPRIPMFPPVRFLMDVRPAEELNAGGVMLTVYPASNPGGSGTALTWTPDGQALVFVGRRGGIQRLYVRRLDSLEAKPLDDSVGAQVPVVSADGRWIAFWADGAIKKAPLSAGATETWVDGITQPPIGMAWSGPGLLIGPYEQEGLHERTGTRSVSLVTSGSAPKPVTVVQQGETSHILPHWLPGGRAFLYTARRRASSWSDDQVFAHDVATGARTKLLSDAVDARYVGGYLVFLRRGLLMAVAFDADRLQATGEPFALVNHVVQGLTAMTGAGQYSIAPTGNLAYLEGPQAGWPDARIVTVNRRGDVVPLATPVKSYGMNVRLDPHGRRIANSVYTLTGREILGVRPRAWGHRREARPRGRGQRQPVLDSGRESVSRSAGSSRTVSGKSSGRPSTGARGRRHWRRWGSRADGHRMGRACWASGTTISGCSRAPAEPAPSCSRRPTNGGPRCHQTRGGSRMCRTLQGARRSSSSHFRDLVSGRWSRRMAATTLSGIRAAASCSS